MGGVRGVLRLRRCGGLRRAAARGASYVDGRAVLAGLVGLRCAAAG